MAPFDDSIAFHASAPDGGEGYVLQMERPSAKGFVRLRRWRSPDYTAPPLEERSRVDDLLVELEGQRRAGWRFTLPVERIRAWLERLTWADRPRR